MYRVFVIDDDADQLDVISRSLSTGYEIHSYNSVESALVDLQTLRPEVVLTDLVLPGMSGEELIQKLKDDTVQLIVMTCQSDVVADKFVEEGALWVMTKPLDFLKLQRRVERACAFSSGLRKLRHSGKLSNELKQATESLMVDLDNLIGSMKNVPAARIPFAAADSA
jgi:DNA-binding NtrC family response regulator